MNRASDTTTLQTLRSQFEQQFGDGDNVKVAMAPGRVNLLGDHTDYNDGFVLPMTVDRGVYLALRARCDQTVRIYSVRYNELLEYPLAKHPTPQPGAWSSYVVGVIEELRQRGLVETGFEGVIHGDVPLGAGLSSSAAVEVATAVAIQHLTGFQMEAIDMIRLCQHVEHRYAGVLCGIMDQFASRLGRSNHALFLDCRSLEYKDIAMSFDDVRIVIASSGVNRSLAESSYNLRHAECQNAVDHFSRFDKNVTKLRDISRAMLDARGDELSANIQRRCHHVVAENQRVLDSVELALAGKYEDFGRLMNESHMSLRDLYEVSCKELDVLVEIAQKTEGVLGARMTGAGFGGCTVNLVHKDAISALDQRINREYPAKCRLDPAIFVIDENLEAGPV